MTPIRIIPLLLILLLPLLFSPVAVSRSSTINKIEFRDITVADALRILADQSNLNILASEEAAKIRMTLFLRNIRPMEVLDAMAKTYNLWYKKDPQSGIIRLYTVHEFRLGQVNNVEERTRVFTLRYPNVAAVAYAIRDLFGDRVSLSLGVDSSEIEDELESRFTRYDIIAGRSLDIGGILPSGGGNGGGGGGRRSGRGGRNNNNFNNNNRGGRNSLNSQPSTRDFQNNYSNSRRIAQDDAITGLLTGDSTRGQAVVNNLVRELSPIYVSLFRSQNRVLVRTRDPDALKQIEMLVEQLDAESPTLLMEVKILALELGDDFKSVFDFTINAGDVTIRGLPGVTPFDSALMMSIVSKNFITRLQLLEDEGRVTELATPMLMTSNQEVSRIFVGKEQPIVNAYESSCPSTNDLLITASQCILVPVTDLRPIGTTLLLTPTINADRTVNIRLLVEQSDIAEDQATIPVQVGDELVDADIDVVRSRTFSGTIIGKDNIPMAVGGLIEEESFEREKGIPVLKDIPFLGFFFRETSKARARREIVIIIKPHVLVSPEESEIASRTMLNNLSIHPEAIDENTTMDAYERVPAEQHGGYRLKKDAELYPIQYLFDSWRYRKENYRRRLAEERELPSYDGTTSSQPLDNLTSHAIQSIRQPADQHVPVQGIQAVRLTRHSPIELLPNRKISGTPLESWRSGDLYITPLLLRNSGRESVEIKPQQLRGRWLKATLDIKRLNGIDSNSNTTYLYLLSDKPFDQAMRGD